MPVAAAQRRLAVRLAHLRPYPGEPMVVHRGTTQWRLASRRRQGHAAGVGGDVVVIDEADPLPGHRKPETRRWTGLSFVLIQALRQHRSKRARRFTRTRKLKLAARRNGRTGVSGDGISAENPGPGRRCASSARPSTRSVLLTSEESHAWSEAKIDRRRGSG